MSNINTLKIAYFGIQCLINRIIERTSPSNATGDKIIIMKLYKKFGVEYDDIATKPSPKKYKRTQKFSLNTSSILISKFSNKSDFNISSPAYTTPLENFLSFPNAKAVKVLFKGSTTQYSFTPTLS